MILDELLEVFNRGHVKLITIKYICDEYDSGIANLRSESFYNQYRHCEVIKASVFITKGHGELFITLAGY